MAVEGINRVEVSPRQGVARHKVTAKHMMSKEKRMFFEGACLLALQEKVVILQETNRFTLMMEFRTPVALPPSFLQLDIRSTVMLAGSCFAQHMAARLADALPDGQVCELPQGVLYNPLSIADSLDDLLSENWDAEAAEKRTFLTAEGDWRHWGYSTLTSDRDRQRLLANLEKRWKETRDALLRADVLMVTFSTDHVYRLADGPLAHQVVANCHKQPAALFREEVADAEECMARWRGILNRLWKISPKKKVVFTLSPYRYAKCGMHGNALIKARLLLLIDGLCKAYPDRTAYFPAYEIITDELRDYRFYAPDMLHPSDQAVDYVWERFREWTFTSGLKNYAAERGRLLRMQRHRPFHAEGTSWEAFKQRLRQQEERVAQMEQNAAKYEDS